LDRTLYFFGHAWIKVDTYDKCGKNNGTVSLDFSPEHYFGGSTDFTVNDKSSYPEWFGIKLKSNQKEIKTAYTELRHIQKVLDARRAAVEVGNVRNGSRQPPCWLSVMTS
jgi:hypothetical protein